MKHRRCKTCGVPGQVGRLHRWMTNGTIVNARMTGIRQVFMEADFLPELRERISEGLDFPVSPIFYEAERNSVRVTVEAFLRGPLLRLTARIPIFRRAAVHYFNNLAWATGTASSHTVAYHSGRYGLALMRNPFDLDLMAAVVVGAFEALERKPFRSFWKKEDGAYLLRVEVIKEKPELSGRLEVESEVLKEGDLHLRSCPRCGLPLDLSHLEWREEEGMIIDRRRGMRMINLDGYTPRLVNRELVRELGEEVIPIIIDAKRDYTLKMLKDLGIRSGEDDKARLEALRDMLSLLPLYGWGMASETEYTPGGTLRVWVDNPFDEYLIAGRLAAFYEAAEGKRARVEWRDSGPASITYVLTPSISPA
ncbi:MAG: hypothetical protein PHP28_09660 [Actinomycetota bacterium]|nr:hypothetical protein [Actinomycetota bacterium]MDD5667115.1 hypothetical protein [Actinomycetota bacterium]